MSPQTDKSWRDYRALNQNWSYQTTLVGRAIKHIISGVQKAEFERIVEIDVQNILVKVRNGHSRNGDNSR